MKGAIASGSRHSAEVGAEVLREGGNAVDAAVAAVFTSFATECFYTGPGAGGVALVREASGETRAFDFFAAMPGLGSAEEICRERLDFRPKTIRLRSADLTFHIGRGSSAVPGVMKGLAHLHSKYGRVPLRRLIAPAQELARSGFTLSPALVHMAHVIEPIMADTPEMHAALGGPDGYVADPDHVTLHPYAEMLELIADEGPESIYTGHGAELIVRDQEENGGLITHEDLRRYAVLELEPLRVRLGEGRMSTPPPPSLGGSMVVTILRLWRELAASFGTPPPQSADWLHRWGVVISAANKSRKLIDQVRSVPEPDHFIDTVVENLFDAAAAAVRDRRPLSHVPLPRIPGNTAHLSVIDSTGMAVSITTSPGESAGYLVPGLGMVMNNMLGEDDLFTDGFHSEKAGTRLPTMMAPSILEIPANEEEHDTYVFGSGGSIRIRTALSQFMYQIAEEKLGLEEAIDAPRCHYEKDILQVETPKDEPVMEALRAMGYQANVWVERDLYFGGVNAVLRQRDGVLKAHPDPRRGGWGLVVAAEQ